MRATAAAIHPRLREMKEAVDRQVRAILNSIRMGMCNAEGCDAPTLDNRDCYCPTHFKALPKELRGEMRQGRDVWVRAGRGNPKANAWQAYAMRIVGARLWLKKNASW